MDEERRGARLAAAMKVAEQMRATTPFDPPLGRRGRYCDHVLHDALCAADLKGLDLRDAADL
ncbi:hypothetical protein ASE30_03325 [Achromobacter sp. Root83]|uniref:hypothetical protein n=1 Tax=Achromobacter sp. Root83 TaxID=1736602 RepID=UPI0007089F95|nr:hypothetical protein [Achromobacter sp. Root83]KRC85997.1 hypothetical protein ASE30_03325 [Achromobacter sp. Root83]